MKEVHESPMLGTSKRVFYVLNSYKCFSFVTNESVNKNPYDVVNIFLFQLSLISSLEKF